MRYRHWHCLPHCGQEDFLWQTRDRHHETMHFGLGEVGHIRQIRDGRWLFKALLAAKPHQEHARNIEDFVWRFFVNYIPLNSVTRIIAYLIPRCDSVVFNEFGRGEWWWMFDAPMCYHQLAVEKASQEKLAFQGVDAIKWTYTVMPFGQTNGPQTFINFIHEPSTTTTIHSSSSMILTAGLILFSIP
jgi:hypothetical protein